MLYLISQIGIVLFGVASSFLIAKKNKWGFVLALLAQPFWLIAGILDSSWGILIMTLVYTACSTFGIYTWFFKDMFEYSWVRETVQIYNSQPLPENRG
jgi:hypothetical protein